MESLVGKKWYELSNEIKCGLISTATAIDGRTGEKCNEGKCIIDLNDTYFINGQVIDGEIVIYSESIIYNQSEWTIDRYLIDYQNGYSVEVEVATLNEAKALAEDNISYTQESISIRKDGETISTLYWYDVEAEEHDEVIADFGIVGFYGSWKDF